MIIRLHTWSAAKPLLSYKYVQSGPEINWKNILLKLKFKSGPSMKLLSVTNFNTKCFCRWTRLYINVCTLEPKEEEQKAIIIIHTQPAIFSLLC